MNQPATSSGNWRWRFASDALTDALAQRLATLVDTYDRANDGSS
jgi:4-alpha-glucanotransferase